MKARAAAALVVPLLFCSCATTTVSSVMEELDQGKGTVREFAESPAGVMNAAALILRLEFGRVAVFNVKHIDEKKQLDYEDEVRQATEDHRDLSALFYQQQMALNVSGGDVGGETGMSAIGIRVKPAAHGGSEVTVVTSTKRSMVPAIKENTILNRIGGLMKYVRSLEASPKEFVETDTILDRMNAPHFKGEGVEKKYGITAARIPEQAMSVMRARAQFGVLFMHVRYRDMEKARKLHAEIHKIPRKEVAKAEAKLKEISKNIDEMVFHFAMFGGDGVTTIGMWVRPDGGDRSIVSIVAPRMKLQMSRAIDEEDLHRGLAKADAAQQKRLPASTGK